MRTRLSTTLSKPSQKLIELIQTQNYVEAFELLESDAKANRVFKTANKNIAEVKPKFGTLLHLYIKHYAKSPLGKGETNTEGADKQQFFEEHMLKNMTLEMLEEKIQMAKPRHP